MLHPYLTQLLAAERVRHLLAVADTAHRVRQHGRWHRHQKTGASSPAPGPPAAAVVDPEPQPAVSPA